MQTNEELDGVTPVIMLLCGRTFTSTRTERESLEASEMTKKFSGKGRGKEYSRAITCR
jgi:hypothetical protein